LIKRGTHVEAPPAALEQAKEQPGMSCLIPPACVFCHHYHHERNEQTTELPSCDAFSAIPEEIFMGRFDHSDPFPGDNGVRFLLIAAERENFLELNAAREELGLMCYRVDSVGKGSIPQLPNCAERSVPPFRGAC
jgi:hypothetical protein